MADADRVALRYDQETVFGVTDSGPAPTFKDLRFTSESLRQETTTVNSAEIRSDRQIVDVVRTTIQGSGDINFELSAGSYDDLLEAALLSAAFSTPDVLGPAVTISIVTGTDQYDVADSASGFGAFNVGQWVRIEGFVGPNNGFAKIITAAAGQITVVGNGDGQNESVGPSVTVTQLAQIVNGTTFRSYSVEKEYTDLDTPDVFAIYTGMAIDQWALTVAADAIVTGAFTFMGKDAASASATAGDGTPTPVNTNDVINAVDDVTKIMEGSIYKEIDATNLSWQLNNNLRSRLVIGKLGPISLGTGTVDMTATLQMYFETVAVMDAYLAFTESKLAILIEDSASPTQGYIIDLPRILYTSGQRVAGGQNQDIIADMAISAFRNVSEDVTVRIARF